MAKQEKQQWSEITDKNTQDIQCIKEDIKDIRGNHLHHIEKDMERQTKQIEKIDNRLWWVLGLLVVSVVMSMVKTGIGV